MPRTPLAVVLACLAAPPALAQDVGSAAQGAQLAAEVCAACHATAAGETRSPDPTAPPFAAVAAQPGMGRTALLVWFRSPHPTMPMYRLTPTEEHDLIAHILSLTE
ncbi:MAG: cytochrome c [Rhodobacteraceae bacterium]|jgi:mono/diheme cytochrome c family protein|nr:cytochrome c [Paracoccaceae bacterium]